MVDQANPTDTPANGGQQGKDTLQGGKTFTQEQLDAIIADRLQRERGKYADYEELKGAAIRLAELESSQLSEKEKLERELKEARERETRLAGELQTSRAIAAASKAGALYPDLVAAKTPVEALADDKKLEEALKALRAQYPALFGARGGSADGGAGGGRSATGHVGMNEYIRRATGRA
ncbi:MAG TPA: hypothetical protein PLJ35_15760 [Anaerolineae bacterium]|nr:hypothetical protein [Anaerolineae bacterium]HPL29300.1 hypothetical protein [Anaerolineae bacterium]